MSKHFFKSIKTISISKLQKTLLITLAMQFQTQFALSATTYDISSDTNSASLSALDGIIVNFTNESGSLFIDASKTLNSVSATVNNFGSIKFTTNNNLTINGGVGDTTKSINNITYQNSSDATLTAKDDLYINNGINTTSNNLGNIVLNGTKIQTISSAIGSTNYNLNQLSLNQDFGVDFKKDVYAKTLTTSGNGSDISGTGNLNFTNATFNGNTTISNSGNVNIGKTSVSVLTGKSENSGGASLSSGVNLRINNSTTSFTDLTLADTSSTVIINNGKNLNISGNITGNGAINAKAIQIGESISADKGTLSLSGATTQTIQASIGQSANRLDTLKISNVVNSEGSANSSGIILNNNAYVKNIIFSNNSKTAKIAIQAGKTINLTKNISESIGGKGLISGDGTLVLEGTLAQTIDANLGSSISDRLGTLEIKSTSNVTLNDESYISTLTSSINPTSPLQEFNSLTNNSALNTTNLNINKSLKINGSGAFEIENLNIASGKNLTLDDNKTIKITKAISGLGTIKTSASGSGNIFFSSTGTYDINVANQIGESNLRLNKIIVNTNNGIVNLNNNTFASGIDFINSSGQSKINIASTKTLDVTGDITNLSDSIITGSSTLKLSGTNNEQNIYAKIGDSTNYLDKLEITNPFGATLFQNSFIKDLALNDGIINISDSTLTINNATAFDLNNDTFASKRVNDFGKIKLLGDFNITQSKIIFDYTSNNSDITWSEKGFSNFKEKYKIIEANSLINSDSINLISVSDNSYLFDNVIEIDGNTIVTTIQTSENFSTDNLGVRNYQLLNNILESSNLASKFFRISDKENLDIALTSFKTMPSDIFINNALNVTNTTFNAINTHFKNHLNYDDKEEKSKNFQLWGQIFGDKSVQKNNDFQQKFTTDNYGGIIGIERLVRSDNNILIGSAIVINKSKIADDLKIHNNDINSYQLAFYNKNYTKNNEGFYNKNLANFSFNKYSNSRNIRIGNYQETIKSNLNGKSYSFESGVGYNFKIIDSFSIAPDFSLQYFKFSQNSYKENVLSDGALRVNSVNYNEIITKLGLDFAGNFTHSQIQYKPNFTISWDKKLKNNRQIMQSNFINTSFNNAESITNSLVIAQKNIVNLGFGLNLSDDNNQKFDFKYNLQLSNRFISNGGSLQYSWKF